MSPRHEARRFYYRGRQALTGTHLASECVGDTCVIHRPTNHHMEDWPLSYRPALRIFERHCEHGVGHPDPDNPFGGGNLVHGCDGCCAPLPPYCAEPDCEAFVFDDEQFCESHQRDEWGVRTVDCECDWSTADNADIYVCHHHRKAFAGREK